MIRRSLTHLTVTCKVLSWAYSLAGIVSLLHLINMLYTKRNYFNINRGSNADITQEEVDLAREIIQKDFGGKPLPQTLEGSMTKLLELTSDNWFNAIATKMVELKKSALVSQLKIHYAPSLYRH